MAFAQLDMFRSGAGVVSSFEPNIANYRKLYPQSRRFEFADDDNDVDDGDDTAPQHHAHTAAVEAPPPSSASPPGAHAAASAFKAKSPTHAAAAVAAADGDNDGFPAFASAPKVEASGPASNRSSKSRSASQNDVRVVS